ncbi:MAG: SDR family oxidoreductase [Cytophagaceae bacterium]
MKKTAIITGGTKGIGRACVELFIKQGFQVVTCARKTEDLEQLKKALNSPLLYCMTADLSIQNQVKLFAEFALSIDSNPDLIINNTGIFVQGKLQDEPEGTLEKLMETNVYSAYHLTRYLLPGMISKKQGTIFNICSTASITPYVNGGSYCMTKYALLGMTKVFREELKPYNIRVSAVLPGATLTSSWEGVDLPAERFIPPADIAQTIWGVYNLHPQTVVEEILIRPLEGDIG